MTQPWRFPDEISLRPGRGSGTLTTIEVSEEAPKTKVLPFVVSLSEAPTLPSLADAYLIGDDWFLLVAGPSTILGRSVIEDVQAELVQLRARVAALEEEVEALKISIPEQEVIVLRPISRKQAKKEILELLRGGESLDQEEVAERLALQLSLVAELCTELMQEGEIKYVGDTN